MTYEPKVKVETVTLDLHEIENAYDLLMSNDPRKQLDGLKSLYYHMRAMRNSLDNAVRVYNQDNDERLTLTLPSGRKLSVKPRVNDEEEEAPAEYEQPPIPPHKSMPKREWQSPPTPHHTHIHFTAAQTGKILERNPGKFVIYEKFVDRLLKSFARGTSFMVDEVEDILAAQGYSESSAEVLAPMYIDYMIKHGNWDPTPTDGIYRAAKGFLPLSPDDETAEQKAQRAEDERRAHTEMMGGAH
jgi:hypothetical protein